MAILETRSVSLLTTVVVIISLSNTILQSSMTTTASALLDESFDEVISAFKFGDRIAPRNRPSDQTTKLNEFRNHNNNNNSNNANSADKTVKIGNGVNGNVKTSFPLMHDNSELIEDDFTADDVDDFVNNDNNKNSDKIEANGVYDKGENDSSAIIDSNDGFLERRVPFLSLDRKLELNSLNKSSVIVSGLSRQQISNTNNGVKLLTNVEPSAAVTVANVQIDIRDGNLSLAQAHRLEMSTEFFVVPSTTPSVPKQPNHRPGGIILPNKSLASSFKNTASIVPPYNNNRLNNTTQPTIVSTYSPIGLRKEPWVVPVLVLASLAMLMMTAFEMFVLDI